MRKKRDKQGLMTLKIDLKKAFDHLSWTFIEDTLHAAGLPSDLSRLIMFCIKTASIRLIWNGEVTDSFKSSRGFGKVSPSHLIFLSFVWNAWLTYSG